LHEDRPELSRAKLERVRDLMNAHAEDCLVIDYEGLIDALVLAHPNDRHVLAAAIGAKASLVVTYNLADFPARLLEPHGIKAEHPDAFVLRLLEMNPERVVQAVHEQRQSLRSPKVTAEELLATLDKQRLKQSVTKLREFIALI